MAEKRFAGINGSVEREDLTADFESAEVFDKFRVGKLGVYFRDGFRTRFFGYDDFERAFIRVQEVNGRMCCGKAVFSYCRMVLVRDGKEIANYMSENESAMDAALARIHEHSPATLIGVEKKSK